MNFRHRFRISNKANNYFCSKVAVPLVILLASLQVQSQALTEKPARVISAGGSVTEIINHLGLSSQLIAIDTSSLYPTDIQHLPKIGYFRALSAEGILSLEPTLLVAAKGAGPAAVLNQIENVGVKVKLFSQEKYDLQSWQSLVTEIGQYFNKPDKSKKLVASVLSKISNLQANRQYPINQLNAVSLLSVGQRGAMVAGNNTMPNFLFEMAGFNNLGESVEGYKPINNEALITQKIDLIFVPSHMVEAVGGKQGICNNAIIKLALRKDCHLVIMDGLLLMGLGARIDQALEQVIKLANKNYSNSTIQLNNKTQSSLQK